MANDKGNTGTGGLPFLPGNTFTDPTKERFHVSNTLNFKNGYAQENIPKHPIGGGTIELSVIKPEEISDLEAQVEKLTVKKNHVPKTEFIPRHKEFNKRVLQFKLYFKETVFESQLEHYRVRYVDLYYYLEDDTIMLIEPVVENSGIPQGQVMQRQQLVKEDGLSTWHWRDLNLGMNIFCHGRVYRVINCDQFTRNWYESKEIALNPTEPKPVDPYTLSRRIDPYVTTTKSDFDKLNRFLKLDRKVLLFNAVYDDRDTMFGDLRHFVFHYYLVDDTLEIREVYKANDGRDPFPVLLRRQKLPKDRYHISETFPSCVMELSDAEVQGNWLYARQFIVGRTLTIGQRKFLIHDCDDFTRNWFESQYKIKQPAKITIPCMDTPPKQPEIPPYNGFGSLEDTVQNCLSLIPQPPKKDFIKMLENDNKTLRYLASMVPIRPEDKKRRFIINYRLADDMISIYEPPIRNSGIIGGKFLEGTRIPKPDCDREKPVFYGPADLSIGATISVLRHRFIIQDCDDYVLSYLTENKETFPSSLQEQLGETIQSISDHKK